MASESNALWMRRLPYAVMIGLALLVAVVLLPAIQQAWEAARRNQSRNNLMQIGLALRNYHDAFQMLPPGGTFDSSGSALHGWTTFLDIYLAQSALITSPDYWLFEGRVRGQKSLMTFRQSPDRKLLKVNFGDYEVKTQAVKETWLEMFQRITRGSAIEHVELQGRLLRDELNPFLFESHARPRLCSCDCNGSITRSLPIQTLVGIAPLSRFRKKTAFFA